MKNYAGVAAVAAAAGSILAVLSGAVYLGYLPSSYVGSLGFSTLGVLSAVAFVVAIVLYFA